MMRMKNTNTFRAKTRDIKTEIKSETATTTMSKQTGEQQHVFKQEQQKKWKRIKKMQNPALTQSENE